MGRADDLKRYRDAGASRLIPFSQRMGTDSAAGKAQEQLPQLAPLVDIRQEHLRAPAALAPRPARIRRYDLAPGVTTSRRA
jgi:hypothetical protein